jgi:hypothetical protein
MNIIPVTEGEIHKKLKYLEKVHFVGLYCIIYNNAQCKKQKSY